MITGASMSVTTTVNVHGAVLLFTSVAVLETDVVPTANVLPLAGELTTVGAPQLSLAVGVNETSALQTPRPLF